MKENTYYWIKIIQGACIKKIKKYKYFCVIKIQFKCNKNTSTLSTSVFLKKYKYNIKSKKVLFGKKVGISYILMSDLHVRVMVK